MNSLEEFVASCAFAVIVRSLIVVPFFFCRSSSFGVPAYS